MTHTIAIVDYGAGNLHSVQKAAEHVSDSDTRVLVTQSAEAIKQADRVILPGQGAIAGCMQHIRDNHLTEAILEATEKKPFLAICIGPQLLMEHSEENGGVNGLGVFSGNCRRFPADFPKRTPPLKIPHMGWSQVKHTQMHPLWSGIDDLSRFYFVHSYYLCPTDESLIVGTCDYGGTFACALARDNLFTIQCHPEKSGHAGLRLFHNFFHWNP